MNDILASEELLKRLERMDKQFDAEAMPKKYRAAECFKECYGHVLDGPHRRALFEPIHSWFGSKYEQEAVWDGIIGRLPVLIRGQLFLVAIAFTSHDVRKDFCEGIEGLPKELAKDLSLDEFKEIAEKQATAHLSFNSIYTLRNDDHNLPPIQRDLIRRAQFDLDNAPFSLKHNEDTQTATIQAKEAAEKFLKVALLKSGSKRKPEEFKHNLTTLFKELTQVAPRYKWLDEAVASIQQNAPDMQLRYRTVPRTIASAISTFRSALYICGVLAQMWNFDLLRGSENSGFRPTAYYLNGVGIWFWCQDVKDDEATLLAFEEGEIKEVGLKRMKMSTLQSSMYIEVKDSQLEQTMTTRLLGLVSRIRPEKRDETQKIKRVKGKEGSYVVALSRKSIRS
jgi:HEPN domain-containing protein